MFNTEQPDPAEHGCFYLGWTWKAVLSDNSSRPIITYCVVCGFMIKGWLTIMQPQLSLKTPDGSFKFGFITYKVLQFTEK